MKPRNHLRLLVFVSIAWALFWLAGLPDYYQQYSVKFMVLFDLAILPPIWFIVYRSSKYSRPGNAINISFWWAFYISVPLFVYDLIYCGYYLGHGPEFLVLYWYLTVYYVLPWILFPPTGWLVERFRSSRKTSIAYRGNRGNQKSGNEEIGEGNRGKGNRGTGNRGHP